jgi:hypothetical protein
MPSRSVAQSRALASNSRLVVHSVAMAPTNESNRAWRTLAGELLDAEEAHRCTPTVENEALLARARRRLEDALQAPPRPTRHRVDGDRIGNSGP